MTLDCIGGDYLLVDTKGNVVKEFMNGGEVLSVFLYYSGKVVEDNKVVYKEYDSDVIHQYTYKGNRVKGD